MNPRHSASRPHRVLHARKHRGHPLLTGTALVVLAAMSFGVTAGATAWIRLSGNIETHDISSLVDDVPQSGDDGPADPDDANAGRALNLLVMGSDVRDGENALLGGEEEGMRSDTTIIVHISADRSRIDAVSIPRDTRVNIPSCNFLDGSSSRPQSARFNAAFSIGARNENVGEAAACTIQTVQSLTGITIDGWVVVDFAGFRNMVDALGGVPMCIPNDMESPKAGLSITAGWHRLDGHTALALARARTGRGLGNGSDLNRLGRQQQLLGAIAQEVFAKNLLTDLDQLYRFLDAATESLTADPNTGDIRNLAGLAWSLQNIPPDRITFMTAPYAANPNDGNEVIFTSDAAAVWAAFINDTPMVPPPPEAPADPVAPADPGTSQAPATGTDASVENTANTPAAPATATDPNAAAQAPAAPATAPSTPPPTPGVDPITAADTPVCG